MNALLRRRGMMVLQNKIEVSHFIPGVYSGGRNGSDKNTVDENGVITCNTGNILYKVRLPITELVYYKVGDVIELEQDRAYNSIVGTSRSLTLKGSADLPLFSGSISNYESKQVTAQNDGFFSSMYWGDFRGYQLGVRLRYRILINGIVVVE